MSNSALPTTYGIVGAGPAGLVTARAFLRQGIDVELLERHDRPGGIWNIEQDGSPMYTSCNFISSREFGGFIGYPMPEHYPMYPTWSQIRDYVHGFARDFGLDKLIRLRSEVVHAKQVHTEQGSYWETELADGEVRQFRGLVIATGAQWAPNRPTFANEASYSGRIIHSAEYTGPEMMTGRKVMVVGAGNSGVDIVADASFHADAAYLSTRRGYWFLPKFLFGVPVPDLLAGNVPPQESGPLAGKTMGEIFELVLGTLGDLSTFGLPTPDHELGASHPIVNGQVLHCLAHGMLEHRNDLIGFDGNYAITSDGRRTEVDLVITATGYDVDVPWLDEGVLGYVDGHPCHRMGTFLPGVDDLYLAGALHFAGNTFSIFDRTVHVAAAHAKATLLGHTDRAAALAAFDPDLQGDFPFLNTRRNANQVHIPALEEAFDILQRDYGIEIPDFMDRDFFAGHALQFTSPEDRSNARIPIATQ